MTDPSSRDASPSRDASVAWRVIGDEAILVSSRTGKVHTLNAVGARLWQLIDGSHSVEALTAIIGDEFDVSTESAATDCAAFLTELRERGLVA